MQRGKEQGQKDFGVGCTLIVGYNPDWRSGFSLNVPCKANSAPVTRRGFFFTFC